MSKFRYVGVGQYPRGTILTMIKHEGTKVSKYSDGETESWLYNYDAMMPDVEIVRDSAKDFVLGSKWVSMINQYCRDNNGDGMIVLEDDILRVSDCSTDYQIVFNGGSATLTKEMALLTLVPYVENVPYYTLEDLEDILGYEFILKETV